MYWFKFAEVQLITLVIYNEYLSTDCVTLTETDTLSLDQQQLTRTYIIAYFKMDFYKVLFVCLSYQYKIT